MLNTMNMIKALVISVALAFLLSVGGAVLFGTGVNIDPGLDWEKVNAMSFSEATAYIGAHTKPVSGWESFKMHVQWLAFVTPAFFVLIGSLFGACVALLWWVRCEGEK